MKSKLESEVIKAMRCMNRLRVELAKVEGDIASRSEAITRTACLQGDLSMLRGWVQKVQDEVAAAQAPKASTREFLDNLEATGMFGGDL